MKNKFLYIQDRAFSKTESVDEALLSSCNNAIGGYGAFAFASKDGVDLILRDNLFLSMIKKGQYHLVIGIDEITNERAVNALNEIAKLHKNLSIKIYFSNDSGSIFHPKFSLFKAKSGEGFLVVGSGNLTLRGLRKNKEAFAKIKLTSKEYTDTEAYLTAWLRESEANLRDLDDPEVLEKAKSNVFISKKKKKKNLTVGKDSGKRGADHKHKIDGYDEEVWEYSSENEILFAEIPGSGNRWKQANFDKENFTNFFGAIPGNNFHRILLRHVDEFALSDIENRQSVSVKSQNYRFELDAASGLDYPANGRPIGVFIKVATRIFMYHLFMPGDPMYFEILNWMKANWSGKPANRKFMKRIKTKVLDVEYMLDKTYFYRYKKI